MSKIVFNSNQGPRAQEHEGDAPALRHLQVLQRRLRRRRDERALPPERGRPLRGQQHRQCLQAVPRAQGRHAAAGPHSGSHHIR